MTSNLRKFPGFFSLALTAIVTVMVSCQPIPLVPGALVFNDWEAIIQTDPFTDKTMGSVMPSTSSALRKIGGGRGDADDLISLGFICMPYGISPILSHKYLVGDRNNSVQVRIRIDDNPPYGPGNWGLWIDRETTIPRVVTKDITTALQQMLTGDTVLVRVTDQTSGESLTTEWSLNGFSEAIKYLPCYSDATLQE